MSSVISNFICPSLGVAICTIMWIAPLKDVILARQRGNLQSLNPIPFAATILNCLGWTIYSCMKKDLFVFFANAPGIVLGVFNVVSGLTLLQARMHVFIHTYSEERNDIFDLSEALAEYYSNYALYRKVEALFIFSVAFCLLAVGFVIRSIMGLVAATAFDDSKASDSISFIGTLACAFSVGYYAAPLSTAVAVISSKDASTLHLPTIVANTTNAILWTVYGLGIEDWNLVIPNGFGFLLAAIQLALLYVYKKSKADPSHSSPESLSDSPTEYLYRLLYRINFVQDADSYLHSFHTNSSNRNERNKEEYDPCASPNHTDYILDLAKSTEYPGFVSNPLLSHAHPHVV